MAKGLGRCLASKAGGVVCVLVNQNVVLKLKAFGPDARNRSGEEGRS